VNQRGFSLPVVLLSLGVVTVSSLVLLDVINVDLGLLRVQRDVIEGRLRAEGGLMEVLNDQRLQNNLPDTRDAELSASIEASPDSLFSRSNGGQYTAEVQLLRLAPLLESSQGKLQAVVYELVVDADDGSHQNAGVRAEIYKFASTNSGLIRASQHAR
jgi:hypothetical protein